MLLPVLYTVRSSHIHCCVQDVVSAVQQSHDLPDRLKQDLARKFPQHEQNLQAALQGIKDVHVAAEELLACGMQLLQKSIEGWDEHCAEFRESTDSSGKPLSIQEKHLLLLHKSAACSQEGDAVMPSIICDLHRRVIEAAETQREVLQKLTDKYLEYFARIEALFAFWT